MDAETREQDQDKGDEIIDTTATTAKRRKERHRAVPLHPEIRFFAPTGLEVRRETRSDAATDDIIITGAPIAYNAPYRVVDMFGEFEERMHPGCVDEILARGVDCRFLLNHEGMAMARTTSGTLKLWDTPTEMRFEARLDARQQIANDFAIAVERGDMTQMSVGMIVGLDEWGVESGMETRDIYKLRDLLDVSGVTYPCSPTTHMEVAQRMAVAMPLESRARLRRMEVELRAGKVLSADSQSKLVAALSSLHDLASAGGIDPQDIGPNGNDGNDDSEGDSVQTHSDGSEGSTASAESDSGVVHADGSGARSRPTEAEIRAQIESFNDIERAVYDALCDAFPVLSECYAIYVCDLGTDWVVWQSYGDEPGLFRCSYSITDGNVVVLGGELEPVVQVTTFAPITEDEPDDGTPELREDDAAPEAAPMKASTLRLMVEAGRVLPN